MTEDIAAKIRHRAFQIWQEQGQPHGRDQDHWLQAEAEVTEPAAVAAVAAVAEVAPPKKAPAKKAVAPKAAAAKPKKTPAAKA